MKYSFRTLDLVVWLPAIFILLISCKTEQEESSEQTMTQSETVNTSSFDLRGMFKLELVDGDRVNAEKIYATKTTAPYLTFDTTTNIASGHTGCNSFTLSYELADPEILFSKAVEKTEKACEPGAHWENRLIEIISGSRAQLEGNRLTIRNQVGRLIYER
jgi:heat shock protein HslJ